jgi:hypothetical protein
MDNLAEISAIQSEAEARLARAEAALLSAAYSAQDAASLMPEILEFREARAAAELARAQIDAARKAAAEAFPEVAAAIEAVRLARRDKVAAEDAFIASLTPEQRQLQAAIESADDKLAFVVDVAKTCVLAAGVSPSGAFVISRRSEVSADQPALLPAEYLSVKSKAAKLLGTPEAELAGLKVSETLSVSYYPNRNL